MLIAEKKIANLKLSGNFLIGVVILFCVRKEKVWSRKLNGLSKGVRNQVKGVRMEVSDEKNDVKHT